MPRRKGPSWYDGTWATEDENTGEEFTVLPFPVGPVKPSTLKLADDLMAEKCREDKIWRENRENIHKDWLKNRPTQTLAEYVDQVCEQIRRGR